MKIEVSVHLDSTPLKTTNEARIIMDSDLNFNNDIKTQQNQLTAAGKTLQELKDF